jgi:hypothetical protein
MLNLRAGSGPTEWVVVRLSPPGGTASAGVSQSGRPAADEPVKIKSSPPGAPGVKVPA